MVGLRLIVAAELEHQQPDTGLEDAAERPDLRRQDLPHAQPQLCQRRLGHLASAVASRHVPDLVPQHAHRLGLGVHVREDSARQIDETARQRERVHGSVVEHPESPRQAGALTGRRHALTHAIEPRGELRVVIQTVGGDDLLVVVATDRDLLRLAQQHELATPGDRVHGAGNHPDDQEERKRSSHSIPLGGRGETVLVAGSLSLVGGRAPDRLGKLRI